jgi:hypothetical protein
MFSEPGQADFDRMLLGNIECSQREIAQAVMAVVYKVGGHGLNNSRFPLLLEEEIAPIFSQSTQKVMHLVIQVAEKSSLALDQLVQAAHPELIKLSEYCVGEVSRYRNSPGALSVANSLRQKLIREIERAEQDLRVGFVGGKPAATMEPATNQAKALKLLKAIYEATRLNETPVFVMTLQDSTGLSEAEIQAAWRYLRDRGLVETFSIPNTARINANGIDAIESATHAPDRPSANFPSVTYNYVNNTLHVGTAVNSPLQQGGAASSQNVTITYEAADLSDLRRVLDHLAENMAALKLGEVEARKARAQIATLQAQLDSDPDPIIVRQAGKTLRNVTEGAIAGLIAAGIQPALWSAAATLFARLFG